MGHQCQFIHLFMFIIIIVDMCSVCCNFLPTGGVINLSICIYRSSYLFQQILKKGIRYIIG